MTDINKFNFISNGNSGKVQKHGKHHGKPQEKPEEAQTAETVAKNTSDFKEFGTELLEPSGSAKQAALGLHPALLSHTVPVAKFASLVGKVESVINDVAPSLSPEAKQTLALKTLNHMMDKNAVVPAETA